MLLPRFELIGACMATSDPAIAVIGTATHLSTGAVVRRARPVPSEPVSPRVANVLRRLGRRGSEPSGVPEPDLSQIEEQNRAIVGRAFPHTMTGVLRLDATVRAVRHCVARGLPGAFVECGVWRGGSVLAMLLTLQELGVDDRDVFLFDTFEGMTEPTERDVTDHEARPAIETWEEARSRGERPWGEMFGADVFDESTVRDLLAQTGYPAERLHFVAGPVEQTLPAAAPDAIALLRLDTDWYESTRHELVHLYPRLVDGGVLIVDDYGHWQGARQAVDEYFSSDAAPLLLNRIDYTGVAGVKT
jgi:hypothetical protein